MRRSENIGVWRLIALAGAICFGAAPAEAWQHADPADSAPLLGELAGENRELDRERRSTLRAQYAGVQRAAELEARLRDLERAFHDTQALVNNGELTAARAAQCRSEIELLPDARLHAREILLRQDTLREARLRLAALRSERVSLSNLPGAALRVLRDQGPAAGDVRRPAFEAVLLKLLAERRDAIDRLAEAYVSQIETLAVLDERQYPIVERARTYQALVAAHTLWLRDAPALRFADREAARATALRLADSDRWLSVLWALRSGYVTRWPVALAGFCAFLLLAWVRRRIRAEFTAKRAEDPAAKPTPIGLLHSAGCAVAVSLPLPALVWLAGWLLTAAPLATDFAWAVGDAIRTSAGILLAAALLRYFCSESVAGTHLGWTTTARNNVRRETLVAAIVAIPLVLAAAAAASLENGPPHALARAMLVVGALLWAVFHHRLLRGHGVGLSLGYVLAVVAPLLVAAPAILGYTRAAQAMALNFGYSVAVLAVVAVTYAALSRLLYDENAAKPSAAASRAPDGDSPASAAPEDLVVESAGDARRTNRLMQTMAAFVLVVAGLAIWSDILPGLADRTLWPGVTVPRAVLAGCVALLTLVALIDLPAAARLVAQGSVAEETRTLLARLSRPLLLTAGAALAAALLGVGWSHVQWVVVAVVVAAGFALRTPLTNAVCGLFVLGERGVRVGEVLQVGDFSGRVARVGLLDTTLIDAKDREMIVPNEDLVGGRMVKNPSALPPIRRDEPGASFAEDTPSFAAPDQGAHLQLPATQQSP